MAIDKSEFLRIAFFLFHRTYMCTHSHIDVHTTRARVHVYLRVHYAYTCICSNVYVHAVCEDHLCVFMVRRQTRSRLQATKAYNKMEQGSVGA